MTETGKNPTYAKDRRSLRHIIIHRPMQREFTLITIAIMLFSAVVVNFLIQYTLQEIIASNVSGFGKIGAYNVLSDASFELIVRVTLVMFVTIMAVGLFGADVRVKKNPSDYFDWEVKAKPTIVLRGSDLGMNGKFRVRDVWRQQDLGIFDGRIEAEVPQHGVKLFRIFRQ